MNIGEREYSHLYRELRLYWADPEDEETLCDRLESLAPRKQSEVYV